MVILVIYQRFLFHHHYRFPGSRDLDATGKWGPRYVARSLWHCGAGKESQLDENTAVLCQLPYLSWHLYHVYSCVKFLLSLIYSCVQFLLRYLMHIHLQGPIMKIFTWDYHFLRFFTSKNDLFLKFGAGIGPSHRGEHSTGMPHGHWLHNWPVLGSYVFCLLSDYPLLLGKMIASSNQTWLAGNPRNFYGSLQSLQLGKSWN